MLLTMPLNLLQPHEAAAIRTVEKRNLSPGYWFNFLLLKYSSPHYCL
jgi:hypothetical protein